VIDRQYGVANRARNDLAIRQLKLKVLLAPLNADCIQYGGIDPRGLGTGVDHQAARRPIWKSPD